MKTNFSIRKVLDMNIENHAGEHLGKVEDIVVNYDGIVDFIILSYGGLFGTTFNDKRFAVPFSAFICHREGSELKLLLNINKEFLENNQGFDKENAPEAADMRFADEVKQYYRKLAKAA